MPTNQTKSEELLASFSWWERRKLRRTPPRLNLRLRILFAFQWLGFFVLLGVSLLFLGMYGPILAAEAPLLFAILTLVAIGRHAWDLFGLLGGEAHPFDEATEELRRSIRREDIDTVVKAVGERLGTRGTPNIYIAVDNQANAMSANSMLLNFIPRYNSVFLNSYLFRGLSRDELMAILAHELAHFYRYINPFGRNVWLGVVGSIAACVALLGSDPELTSPCMALFVFWWAPLPFLWIFNKLAGLGQHDLEYACDAIAAEVMGVESTMNALLKIGDRAEIYDLVEREMARHLDVNPEANREEVVESLLEKIPDRPMSPEEARRALRFGSQLEKPDGREEESPQFAKAMRQSRKLRKALKVVPWSRFDTIRRDGRLDREEIHQFVKALAQDKHTATHELITEHPKQERYQSHPATRKRIVYLYLHFLANENELCLA